MKTATLKIEAVSLWCPHCNAFVSSPLNGSSLLSPDDTTVLDVKTLTCWECGDDFAVPAAARKIARV